MEKHFRAKKLRKVKLRVNLTAHNISANLRPKATIFMRQLACNSTPIDLPSKLSTATLNLRKPTQSLERDKQHVTSCHTTISHPITKLMERKILKVLTHG